MAQYVKVLHQDVFYGPIRTKLTLGELLRILHIEECLQLRSLTAGVLLNDKGSIVPSGIYESVRDPHDQISADHGTVDQARINNEISNFAKQVPRRVDGKTLTKPAKIQSTVVQLNSEIDRKLEEALNHAYGKRPSLETNDLTVLLEEVEFCFLELMDLMTESASIAGPGDKKTFDMLAVDSNKKTLYLAYSKLVEIYDIMGMYSTDLAAHLRPIARENGTHSSPKRSPLLSVAARPQLSQTSENRMVEKSNGTRIQALPSNCPLSHHHIKSCRLPYPCYEPSNPHKSSLNFPTFLNLLVGWRDTYIPQYPATRYSHRTDCTDPSAHLRGVHRADQAHAERRLMEMSSSNQKRKSPVHCYRVAPSYLFRRVTDATESVFPPPAITSSDAYMLHPQRCLKVARKRFLEALITTGCHHNEELSALITVIVNLEAAAERKRCKRDVIYPEEFVRHRLREEFRVEGR